MVLPDLHVPRAKLLLISNCHRLKKKQTNIFFKRGKREKSAGKRTHFGLLWIKGILEERKIKLENFLRGLLSCMRVKSEVNSRLREM
jgi:hypothetical protein